MEVNGENPNLKIIAYRKIQDKEGEKSNAEERAIPFPGTNSMKK